jgi:peptidoglycan hydrolase CwlO-like protein
MFNKKMIKEIEASIKSLSNKISKLESKSEQILELQTQFEQILDKLDDETFTKDWDEYLKWKEMKDQLPEIEEMYNL